MNHVDDASQKLLPKLQGGGGGADDVSTVTQETEALRSDYRTLQADVSRALSEAESLVEARRNYEELRHELEKWLGEAESQTAAESGQAPAELPEKRAQLQRLKVGHSAGYRVTTLLRHLHPTR